MPLSQIVKWKLTKEWYGYLKIIQPRGKKQCRDFLYRNEPSLAGFPMRKYSMCIHVYSMCISSAHRPLC